MNEVINEKISVIAKYDRIKGTVFPVKLRWQGRDYFITKLAYYHKISEGRKIHHIFHVSNNDMDFKLRLDSENLHWTLEEITDGVAA